MPTDFLHIDANVIEASHVGDGIIEVREHANLVADGALSDGSTVEIGIAYDTDLRRYVADSVKVERPGSGLEVTAKLIREVKVQEFLNDHVLSALVEYVEYDVDGENGRQTGADFLDAVKPAGTRDRREVLFDAQVIYELARIASLPPLATVADRLKISQSTATRLIAETKLLGDG